MTSYAMQYEITALPNYNYKSKILYNGRATYDYKNVKARNIVEADTITELVDELIDNSLIHRDDIEQLNQLLNDYNLNDYDDCDNFNQINELDESDLIYLLSDIIDLTNDAYVTIYKLDDNDNYDLILNKYQLNLK